MAWAKNGTPNTLQSTGNTLTISDMTANEFNIIMWHVSGSSSNTVNAQQRFNNNSNGVYARRGTTNGRYSRNVDENTENEINYGHNWVTWANAFNIQYICSISGQDKLLISKFVGAGLDRVEEAGKFVPSPDTGITRVDIINNISGNGGNDGSGNMQIGDNLSALGSEGVESMTVQDGAVYYETDTNKEYVLYDNTWTEL